ncbi:hypothetical protein J31TS4_23990 [Paenibacillus sp. J31TS4]|uniref:hypothetical protein n=1 Tax=Paenibacillus sp. J31TS4 TaxID=2807195 RepID=UPI001B252438|nr:hypothetical protein [Paenibacillus sp. J31TS4]GIP39119.1 hypothetical protein J31TS4_23990 [Paenibacillus sp. J31TS4]
MAFGITREEMNRWKQRVASGELAYLTHYWLDPRFASAGIKTVTKVGCSDLPRLAAWCQANGLDPAYIHARERYPHFDLIGPKQREILYREQLWDQIHRFGI